MKQMLLLGLILPMILADSAWATSYKNCFSKHLEEAIELNQFRRGLYSDLTNGKSRNISRKMIWTEWISKVLFASGVDQAAHSYQEAGINIVCEEFITMDKVPPFRERFEPGPPQRNAFVSIDFDGLKKELSRDLDTNNFAAMTLKLERQIVRLEKEPRLNCLARHLFESMLRILDLAPQHEKRARSLGISSPLDISKELLSIHLLGFGTFKRIDEEALAVQLMGIPLVCQDIPEIPRARR
ncbi:MAG: hypothetical protein IPM97_11070 [Bdellovibrionaceae bacterium]|nr:hypothetical protein [Pseudobdellovibrionaceae bacterium]